MVTRWRCRSCLKNHWNSRQRLGCSDLGWWLSEETTRAAQQETCLGQGGLCSRWKRTCHGLFAEGLEKVGKICVMVCWLRDWKMFGKYVLWFVYSGIGKCWEICVMVCLLRDWKMLENMCHGLFTEGLENVGKICVMVCLLKDWKKLGKYVKEHILSIGWFPGKPSHFLRVHFELKFVKSTLLEGSRLIGCREAHWGDYIKQSAFVWVHIW